MTDELQRITVQQWEDVRKDIRDLKHEDASLDRRVDANEDDIRIWGSRVEELESPQQRLTLSQWEDILDDLRSLNRRLCVVESPQQRFERTNDGQCTVSVSLSKYNKLINAVKLILLEQKAYPDLGCTPGGLTLVREALADMDKE